MREAALLLRHFPRGFEAVDGGESDLALCGVFARSLAQGFGRFFYVEDVIHNLEGETDVFAVSRQGFNLSSRRYRPPRCHHIRALARSRRIGLSAMDAIEQFRRGRLPLAFNIRHLATNHAIDGAGGER